jgi:hypothetical protein
VGNKQMDKKHEHDRIEVISSCAECGQELDRKSFSRTELANQEVEGEMAGALPNREAMSLVNANIAAPINAALALNVLSDGSLAYASATQYAPIDQST